VTRTGPPAAVTAPDGTPRRRAWARALASRPVAKVIGAGRLALMAVTAVVATLVAVLVIGPWGWTSGIAVSHGAPITGPVPQPSAEPGVLYTSPDGSLSIPDPTLDGDDHTIRFDVTAEVGADHSVTVTEDIAESFAAYRHGIERDVPLRDAAGEHAMRSLVVSADAGTPDNVSVLEGTGFDGVTVRIGDPDRTITGVHRYRLTYVLENVVSDPHSAAAPTAEVLHATPGGPTTRQTVPPATPVDRVALDAFSAWRQPVYGTTYVVKGPQGVVGGLCTQGSEFYRVDCASTTLAADGATFSSAAPVQAYNDVTIQVDWPKGTFGPAVVDGPERGTWPVRLLAMGLSLVGVVVVAIAAFGRRRQLWSRTRRGVVATFGGAPDAVPSELVPASPRVDAPIEFVPPMGLRPAELLRLEEGNAADPARLFAATVIDLAASGELELVAARDDDDWVARRRPGGSDRQLRRYEDRLLVAMFPEGVSEVRFGDRTKEMGESRDRILEQLDDDMKDGKLLARRLGSTPSGCTSRVLGAAGLFVATVAVAGFGAFFLRPLPWAVAMLVAGGVVALAVALYGLRRVRRAGRDLTTTGLGAAYRAEGFRRFFDESEEMHARAAADAGLMRQYLGYAVAFDAVDRWVGAFAAPDLTWMGTTDVALVNGWVYGSAMRQASTPPAPVRTGSSSSTGGFGGGFGGGGFGGGSGGGGGGSW
jgi:uncharacterized membrane protein YgcG